VGGGGGGQTYTKQEAGDMFTSLQDSVTLTSSVCCAYRFPDAETVFLNLGIPRNRFHQPMCLCTPGLPVRQSTTLLLLGS
jgi:hypothetical protein